MSLHAKSGGGVSDTCRARVWPTEVTIVSQNPLHLEFRGRSDMLIKANSCPLKSQSELGHVRTAHMLSKFRWKSRCSWHHAEHAEVGGQFVDLAEVELRPCPSALQAGLYSESSHHPELVCSKCERFCSTVEVSRRSCCHHLSRR